MKGLMGFDALILFAAVLMIIGVIAIFLLTASRAMENKIVTKTYDHRKQISSGLEIINIRGEDASVGGGTPHRLEDLYIMVRLMAGTIHHSLNETIVVYHDGTGQYEYFYNASCTSVCPAITTTQFMVHYLKKGNHWENGHLNTGDVILISIKPESPIVEDRLYRLGVVPHHGPKTYVEFLTPNTMVKEKVTLWPVN